MRYFAIEDDAADKLYRTASAIMEAIEGSTAAPGPAPPGPAPGPAPTPAPAPAPTAAPAPFPSESDLIIHPRVYGVPATGNPPPSANQSPGPDRVWWATASSGSGYFVDRATIEKPMTAPDVSDMTPGHWSRAHILGAILNSGALPYGPTGAGMLVWTALHEATGEPVSAGGTAARVAVAISDTQGSKFSTALAHMRAGATAEAAFGAQKAGTLGNYTDPDFTLDELTGAWALAQSYGVTGG